MKIKELFESIAKINHGKIVDAVVGLVAKNVKIDPANKRDLMFKVQHTDQFWSGTIDDVTRAIEQYVKMPTDFGTDPIVDAIDNAFIDISNNIIDYYANEFNHEPGYKAIKVSFNSGSIKEKDIMDALFAAAPAFKDAYDQHQVKMKAAADAAREARKNKKK